MARGKRKVPDINSSSTADIAFLLLIFFLITTSMDTDRGLARLLPPPPEDQDQQNTDKIKERNILQVYLNKDDALMCGNDYIGVEQLREKAKEFIANAGNAEHMPEKTQKNQSNDQTENSCNQGNFHTTCNNRRRDITYLLDLIKCLHHTDYSTQESE